MIDDVEAAYAAGIFEGEGSITLTRNHRNRWPSPQVSVASNDREVLGWLRSRFGGAIASKKPRLPHHSASYDWKLTDRRALTFLHSIRPYRIMERKIKRVEMLLEVYLSCTPRNGRYTTDELIRKKALVEQFFSLP